MDEENTTNDGKKLEMKAMHNIIFWMKLIRMWPLQNKTFINNLIHHVIILIIFINNCIIILSYLTAILKGFNNVDNIAAVVDYTTVCVSATFRYVHYYIYGKKHEELIKTIFDKFIFHPLITNDNDNDNNDGRKESIDKFYKMAKKICLTYSTLTISWVLSIILSPVLKWLWTVTFTDTKANDLPFPQILPGYFPVDHTKIPQGPICYFMQTFTSTVVCIMYVATDTLWCFIIFLTMGQYNFLKVSIKSIGEYINDGRKSEEEGGEGGVEEDCMPLEKNKMIQVEMKLKKCLKFHGFLTE